ncbi:MAG: DUF333 domain-containing protein [Gemmatimonadota bacterium]|jgi:putative hemolysin|nr:DUF333 domain-containing protein [Gemmatimonadota bacterium]
MKRLAMIPCLLLVGCGSPSPSAQPVGLANPASVYCVEQGGTVEVREEAAGQAGYCHLADGRVVEEWAFFREATASPTGQVGIPNPASAYCIEQGGTLEIREVAAGQAGFCHLPDGRVIDEWELFRSQTSTQGS